MNKIATIGRILFALPFAFFGINHFVMILTGLMLIVASISIITKKFVILSTFLLAGLLFLFIVTIHIPHLVKGVDTTVTLITMLKDISLMGGSLLIAGIYSVEKENK